MREAIAGILLTKMILRGASSRGWPGATRLLRPKHARPKVQKRFSKEKDEQCSPTREVHASRTSRRPRKLTSHCTVVLRVAGRGVGSAPVDATQAPTENRSLLSIPTKVFLISAYCSGLSSVRAVPSSRAPIETVRGGFSSVLLRNADA